MQDRYRASRKGRERKIVGNSMPSRDAQVQLRVIKKRGQIFSDSTPKVDFVLRRADVNHFRCRLSKHTCQSNLFRNRFAVSCTPNRVYTALDAENSELYYTVEFEQMLVLQTRPMKCDPPLRRDSKSILVAGSSPGPATCGSCNLAS